MISRALIRATRESESFSRRDGLVVFRGGADDALKVAVE